MVAAETVSIDVVLAGMREVLLSKLNEVASSLGQEKDGVRQEQLVSLMTKYYDLLEKLFRDSRGLKSEPAFFVVVAHG